MENIFEELGIPKKYLKPTSREDRFVAIVHRNWLKSLLKHSKLTEFNERIRFEGWPYSDDELGQSWMKIFVRVFRKREAKAIPLPRIRSGTIKEDPPLLFTQLLQYISQANYRNLWKEAYKKYSISSEHGKETQVNLSDYNVVLREIITRTYGCEIVNTCDPGANNETSKEFSVHLNILPAVCAVETLNAIFLLHIPHVEHNLSDCVTFSPAVLGKCYAKPLFIVYQLLNILKSLHDRSLTLGDITLSDVYLSEDLWIMIFPQLNSNIHVRELPKIDAKKAALTPLDCHRIGHKFENFKCQQCGMKTYDKIQVTTESLERLCRLWVDGQISNFTYLTALNNLSGRKFGDPNCHHVFPWVSDFSSRCGKNWRDLKKSKYRLNKGDRQLDLMYENTQTQIAHHVSDVLSSITYFVYTARRTPKSVLCKNVRTIWVPAEYPSSIQRLQEWTPDECIPEFFSDPTVFKSIHDDLDDLEVPAWSSSPEDFVEKHREILESAHVSERLHYWIDLTFGYKLSGHAAVKAKNVCLHLVDGHSNITSSGIVQLFAHPHPPKGFNSLFWSKLPPKITILKSPKHKTRDQSAALSSVTVETSRSEEELDDDVYLPHSANRSASGLSRLLSRSRSSLNEEQKEQKASRSPSNQRSSSVGPKNATFTSHVIPKPRPNQLAVPQTSLNTGIIYLPKEYNPAQALNNLENKHNFYNRTFHVEYGKQIVSFEPTTADAHEIPTVDFFNCDKVVQNAFTNQIFAESFEAKLRNFKSFSFPIDNQTVPKAATRSRSNEKAASNLIRCNYMEIIAARRVKELQILGCLIVEIFMAKQLRALGRTNVADSSVTTYDFNDRLKSCLTILRSCRNEIPGCVRYIAKLLLQSDNLNPNEFKYPSVTNLGLPPPSAHLLLEPLLNRCVPFSPHFASLYRLIGSLKDFENVAQELNVLYHFDCNGEMCTEYENLEKTKVLFAQNIAECAVKSCARNLTPLLQNVNATSDVAIIYMLIPYVKRLIEDPPTSVLAVWYLFDPIARILGPRRTSETFLEAILKLYENEPSEATIPYNSKIAKLYHHSFLLQLIVRFGSKCFMEHFVTLLVEAVGGYRDYDKVEFLLHSHEKVVRKTSHLKMIDVEDQELSPSDDSSVSEKNVSSPRKEEERDEVVEPEVFEFENEEAQNEPLQSIIEHLELNVASDLPFVSTAEEALDALGENLRHLEELNLNLDEEYEGKPTLASPTIPIPPGYRQQELNNISCEIGSKHSDNEYLGDKFGDPAHYDVCAEMSSESTSNGSATYNPTRNRKQDVKISETSSDSLLWLSHRLGPVLSARYLSRNLLKMLTLCYVGKENLIPITKDTANTTEGTLDNLDVMNVANSYVTGDRTASKVLGCLASIAALYGEQLILLQYFPHMTELIALCKRKLTPNLEGGLISSLVLLKNIIPYLSDSTLMKNLEDGILKNILYPTVRLLGSTKFCFPNGCVSRNVLARKYVDALYVLSLRMGADMTRSKLSPHSIQRFFLIFEKISEESHCNCLELEQKNSQSSLLKSTEETDYVDIKKDGSISECRPRQISHAKVLDYESTDSLSPPVHKTSSASDVRNQALEELQLVFTSELAYTAYMPFLKQIGLASLEESLRNHTTVYNLSQEYQNAIDQTSETAVPKASSDSSKCVENPVNASSIGSNVALIGNRIDVQVQNEDSDARNVDVLSLISNKMENTSRHLRGNWLAYWEHEIGRSEKDTMFNFKQIKLQTFAGHANTVKSLYVLDNENSFISGSRDKTVKLWSLRSHGDGSSVSTCQWTYTAHKKSILSITFSESLRLVTSCDGVVHIWDPFLGENVGLLENSKYVPVNVVRAIPAPSTSIFAATTEGIVRAIDVRTCAYTHELKINANPGNLIRCLAIASSGLWVAAGQSSGHVTVLDTRTGQILAGWRAHESEVLQLVSLGDNILISSSLDQTIWVWNVQEEKSKFSLKGVTEPVHCLNLYNNELISGTTANRIGVHTSIDADASFSSTKLRSDAFKGLLTSMAVLPLNRLLLLGADNGNINLLC